MDECCAQFEGLLKQQLPELSHHLSSLALPATVHVYPWFTSLLTWSFSEVLTLRAFDIIFFEGNIDIVFKVGLAFQDSFKETLMKLDVGDAKNAMKDFSRLKDAKLEI
ncbi:hypothetical protein FRX31_021318 [Thalictrum thalictroides]|uniref:Rab-GAP TBC domain-containing protein n=1 Tax=Thalictrum thalictroides TaxID=46969 RepID=A0A7J6VYB5_THATH|nr:hypothetical protein FRX31_021318 [Thalictrum thalictroides]